MYGQNEAWPASGWELQRTFNYCFKREQCAAIVLPKPM